MDDEPAASPPANAAPPVGRRKLLGGLAALGVSAFAVHRLVRRKRPTLPPPLRDLLLHATTFEIVAIHPGYWDPPCQAPGETRCTSDGTELLWLHRVLGRARVEAPEQRSELVALIDEAIGDGDDSSAAACFDPRHAVTVTRDGRRVDILICFECQSLSVHDEAESTPNVGTKDDMYSGASFPIGRSVRSRMNEIYRDHGLTLAPNPHG